MKKGKKNPKIKSRTMWEVWVFEENDGWQLDIGVEDRREAEQIMRALRFRGRSCRLAKVKLKYDWKKP